MRLKRATCSIEEALEMVRDDIEREKKAEWKSILNGKLPETTLQKAQREKMNTRKIPCLCGVLTSASRPWRPRFTNLINLRNLGSSEFKGIYSATNPVSGCAETLP